MATVKPIPDGYHSVQPYLIQKDCAAAIDYYRQAFNATERLRMADKEGRIAHAEIQIGDSCVMMADEHPQIQAFSPAHFGGSPVSLMIYVENCDAVHARAVAAGGKSVREPNDQPYGDRMAGILDPFGYNWYIATHIRDLTKEELEQL